jgi:hypothetical protein
MKPSNFRLNFFLVCALLIVSASTLFAQSAITFKVTSLKPGDSCTVYVQKSAEVQFYKIIKPGNDSVATYKFDNLSNGKWEVKIDATGYYFPASKVVELNANEKLVEIKLNPVVLSNSINYVYQWQDDSSYVGHAQQSYINTPYSIQVLNSTITIPDDFSSVTLYNKYGIALSNELAKWTNEDAYRLFKTISNNPLFQTYGEGSPVKVTSVWKIVDTDIANDITIDTIDNIRMVTISKKAFVYANPSVGVLDGIKGRFFSKRLFHAVVAFSTNFGYNKDLINQLATNRYGFKFLIPNQELKDIMNEDFSNFQEFSAFEKLTILDMIEELPEGMHAQTNLKFMARRIAGQVNPVYPNAAAIAWTGKKTIEFVNGAFQGNDYFNIQRLVLHEKAHFLWEGLFNQQIKNDWADLGGWYVDPTVSSGWSTTKTTEFVSAYAHANNPNEDMAESISFYVMNPDMLMSRSIRKFEFIRDRIMNGTRYVAMIRKDLTFMVYNLSPDYNYPGKIKRVDVKVEGARNEDKKVTLEIELNIVDSTRDGASSGYTRFASSIGTIFDVGLTATNSQGNILRGQVTLSKYFKSGYWTVNQIMVSDEVGNKRFENNNTFGLKLFLDNPLEDVTPPKYLDNTLKLNKGIAKFGSMGPGEEVNGVNTQYIEAKFDLSDRNSITYIGTNYALPKLNEKGVKTELQLGVLSNGDNRYYQTDATNSDIKHINYRYPIPEYFPKGYYELTMMYLVDEGGNPKRAFFMNDTSSFQIATGDLKTSKHVRDSIFMDTKYPDFIPPVLDLNAITIKATPTNPKAPDGETLFEMEFFAKDSSAYLGNEAGLKHGSYNLRDPQGKQFNFSMQNDFDKIKPNFFYLIADPEGKPGFWRKYKVSTLLPKGSAPGLWGVESIELIDRANNTKSTSFVELVRFDIEEKDSTQAVTPRVEILGKKVNSKNVDSVTMSIACNNCAQKNYRARIYSDMGGESVLYEGKMTADSIVVKNIKLSGVNDGVIYATVFILDTSKVLLGIGKAQYTKDVVAPKSSLLKTNLSNMGISNIDSLVYDIKVSELNCEYQLVLTQSTIAKISGMSDTRYVTYSTSKQSFAVGDSVILTGKITDSIFKIKNISLSSFADGLINIKILIKDSLGNETTPVINSIYKDTKNPILSIKRNNSITSKTVYTIEANEFVSNSLIKDSLTINVGRIDSLVKISNTQYQAYINRICSDKLVLTVKGNSILDTVGNKNIATSYSVDAPVVPILIRDTSNYLKSSTTFGNTWYKDGVALADTAQRFKPSAAGLYTVTNTIDGCTSVASVAYYYLVTDIAVLSKDEFIKVAPNPFVGKLNIDFAIKKYQFIDIEIYNLATGSMVFSRSNIPPGTQLNLERLGAGNYLLKVFSPDRKMSKQFKLIKM